MVQMLTIRKNKAIIIQVKDDQPYVPTYETEKDKPNSLYVTEHKEDERGLMDD
jgi:hypothetical protein